MATTDTFVPTKAQPPARAGVAGGKPAEDVAKAFAIIEKDRNEWYLVAPSVANPNRWFDALKALGAQVSTRRIKDATLTVERNGEAKTYPAFEVYAMVPKGELKPHRKPSQAR